MEFTELFTALAIVLVAITAIFGLAGAWNNAYGGTLGHDENFNNTLTRVGNILETDFVDAGVDYGKSTQAEEGAGGSTDQSDGVIKRALKTIGMVTDLVGLVPTIIKDGAEALNIPSVYWRIGVSLFWIIFSITLAYLLLMGARSLFG